ncbi:MAG: hypothetical protein PHQ98_02780, partial [Candidatus ainarchaeum sp.]|nr:hypothetical protein [Candidatus ainarchaeum sp.]
DLFYPERTSMGSMVGEENTGVQFFGTKYNALILLPVIGLIALPLIFFMQNRKDLHLQFIMWFWCILTLFMAWYKLKFTFVFGLGLVMGAAITTYLVFELIKYFNEHNQKIEAQSTFFMFICMVVLGVGSAAIFMPDYMPFANSSPYWINGMNWMENNTPEGTKFVNWWGDGHQLAFVTERRFSADNRNASSEANQGYAIWNITEDTQDAYNLVDKNWGANYIILNEDNFSAGVTYEIYKYDRVLSSGNATDSAIIKPYYEGVIDIASCTEDINSYTCRGNYINSIISKSDFETISDTWKDTPDTFSSGKYPQYYYRQHNKIYILNQKLNNTNLAKVWFNSESTKNLYEEAYYYNGLKIVKIKSSN